jgi:signal transduction histidine kinase
MGQSAAAELGSSRRAAEGFPQLRSFVDPYRLRRTALVVLAFVALVTGVLATMAAIEGYPNAGVLVGADRRVEAVSVTGFAWRDGVRPGQLVLARSDSDAVTGWAIVVAGPNGPIFSQEARVLDALRQSAPFALAGLVAGCLAIGFLRFNRAWVLPSASVALVCASVPLYLANHSATVWVLGLSAAVPAVALAVRLRRRRIVAAGFAIASGVLLLGWLAAYAQGVASGEVETARLTFALGGTGVLMADRAMQRRPARPTRVEAWWTALGAVTLGGGLLLVSLSIVPAPVILFAILLALFTVRPLRSMVGRRLELALMSDLRHQVAADVAEEERGRLARELHDSPLQELSAVIRRLEQVPGAQAETASLHSIADQLRSVAVDLRPPMLDDIGLSAAIDFVAEQASTPGTTVVPELIDATGLDRESRPPAAVEFAIYRIVREAVANALRHAEARSISIAGRVAPDDIDLVVDDDGIGIAREAGARASGRGRLGLASMRRRAQAIGAELTVEPRGGTSGGTRVTVRWRP